MQQDNILLTFLLLVINNLKKLNKSLVKNWLVVKIKPNSYNLALRNLERQGFETFFPKMKITIKKENKFNNKEVLLFPGYGFVCIDLQNFNWVKINSTYGVSKLLSFNNKPCKIPLDIIIALKNRYENDVNQIINQKLKRGDKIKFDNGPFAELVANIESVDAKNRIYALLNVMGGHRKLEINLKERINFIKIQFV